MEGPVCTGCHLIIEEGSVIAFGDSLFHLKCFTCAKCLDPVDCESSSLLLTNGRPVCEGCSYCCNACKQVIRDEAIMTGDDAYHAECFQCVSCKNKIDNLVFTQTSKGIHCTPCHEKHRFEKQQKREEREKKLQLKQQAKELPTAILSTTTPLTQSQNKTLINTSTNRGTYRHTSRLFDPQIIADYMQLSSNKDPPTPSRSRSNSMELPSKMRLLLGRPAPAPAPSRSDAAPKSPNSPPILFMGETSRKSKLTASSSLVDMSPLNFSFFDNESTDLVNLTKTLGANISIDIYDKQKAAAIPVIVKTTENITRASQYLESSLMTDEYDFPQRPAALSNSMGGNKASLFSSSSLLSSSLLLSSSSSSSSSSTNTTLDQLRTELDATHAKVVAIQMSYTKIKDASRKALKEFTHAKEEFAKEVALRQHQEYTIVQLKHQLYLAHQAKQLTRPELVSITREEIERVAKVRVELDRTCNELKSYRNVLCRDIESLSKQASIGAVQHALVCEIKSLYSDRDQVRIDTKSLETVRDDVLHDMVMLNTKNAELTEMNNDLTRRVTEREREAAAVMAGTSFLYSPTPSLSSELSSPVPQRRKSSEISTTHQQPKVFKLKKKGGHMFAKLSGKKDPVAAPLYAQGNLLATSSTLSLSQSPESTHHYQQQQQEQHGSHTFLTTSFLRPVKCDTCCEKMWSLSGLRCQGCLYCTHGRCLPHVPQLCYGSQTTTSLESPSSSSSSSPAAAVKLFGSDLSERSQFENRSIPLIIEQCIQAVEKRGMDYEGIYRKSGGATQMRIIRQSFDAGDPVDLQDVELINDICAITSVLKQYFRELLSPLIPFNLYSQFIDTVSNQVGQNKTDAFLELLSQLPKVNYDTLRLLIKHLHSVQQRHDENLMTVKNLAMVFGPTLLRDVESSRDLVDMSYKNAVVEFLIIRAHDLLP